MEIKLDTDTDSYCNPLFRIKKKLIQTIIWIWTNFWLIHMHQKKLLKDMYYFLTLKKLPLALALMKTKNRHPFDPLVRNCSFYMRILSFQWPETIFNWKGHFLTNGSKDVLKKRFIVHPTTVDTYFLHSKSLLILPIPSYIWFQIINLDFFHIF